MAHFLPSLHFPPARSAGEQAEFDVLRALQQGLSDAYVVFHSVNWVQAFSDREIHGELDVVIVNQGGDVMVLEVKAGGLECTPDGLFKDYGGHRKDVLKQVRRQHGALRARLAENRLSPYVHHVLVLPDFRVALGTVQWPRERIVDATEWPDISSRVSQVLGPGEAPGCHGAVVDFFENRFRIEPDVSVLGGQLERATRRLASGLATWVPRISVPQGVIRVRGTAGSGKTQLALRLLYDAAALGRSAAYLCFNRTLADHVARIAPVQACVETFHEHAIAFARRRGLTIEPSTSGAFDLAADELVKHVAEEPAAFDLLVIDEMQDFQPGWVGAMLSRLRATGQAVLLEDLQQNLYVDREPFDIEEAVLVSSNENYRSPRGVVRLINLLCLAEDEVEALSPFEGELPDPIVHGDGVDPGAATASAVTRCLHKGFNLSDIAIVSLRGRHADSLQFRDRLGEWRLQRFTGRFDAAGNAEWTEGELRIDSVRRFKGQSAPAIVLTECDMPEMTPLDRRLLFVGLTRARMHVEWVVSERTALAVARLIDPA